MNVEAVDALGTKTAILTVEKPHIQPFFMPQGNGGVEGCSEEFKRDFIRSRWTDDLVPSRLLGGLHLSCTNFTAIT